MFDWIFFLDFDEYLFIEKDHNINQYLYNKRFEKCQSILFNSKIYDDNNLLHYDNRTLLKRFTHKIDLFCATKSMVRGGIKNLIIPNTHFSGININYFCNSEGERIFPRSLFGIKCYNNPNTYIKHFYTKSIGEFCKKLKRGDAHFNKNNPKYKFIMNKKIVNFFLINKKTKEKIEILNKCLNTKFDI